MKPFYYTWISADGELRTANLHLDGTASAHPDYLNWAPDEIRERILERENITLSQWRRADIAQRNGWLRWLASLNALLQGIRKEANLIFTECNPWRHRIPYERLPGYME